MCVSYTEGNLLWMLYALRKLRNCFFTQRRGEEAGVGRRVRGKV